MLLSKFFNTFYLFGLDNESLACLPLLPSGNTEPEGRLFLAKLSRARCPGQL